MNRMVLSVVVLLVVPSLWAAGTQDERVEIVVAGYITHGPMQPTVQAIKEVTSKYGDRVDVRWVDLGTEEGRRYFDEHGLTAHLNVIINGRYQYKVNGRDVTFQWFEGTQWTKEDLDAVISDLLNGRAGVSPVEHTEEKPMGQTGDAAGGFNPLIAILAAAAAGIGFWAVRRR